MNEDDIEYKQNFLRTQIIDEGYEPEEFSKFLSDEKGDIGLDLNNWKFEDLKNSVIKFKSIKSKNENNNIENIENNNDNIEKENNNNDNIEKENNNIDNLKNENNNELENNNKQSDKISNEENSLQNENIENNNNIIQNNKNEIDTFEIMPSLNEIKTIKEYINCKKQEKNEFTEIDNFKIKISK